MRLKQKAAELVGLALHELAVNAVKYGALSGPPKGRISVSWRVFDTSSGERLSIDWQEHGVPLLDAAPTRTGFGAEMIRNGLPYELGAATSLEITPGGVRCTVELPMTDRLVIRGRGSLIEG